MYVHGYMCVKHLQSIQKMSQIINGLEESKTGDEKSRASIKIPFNCARDAEIVCSTLSVDKQPNRSYVETQFSVEGHKLIAHFTANEPKYVRNAITAFFESMLLCKKTIETFAPKDATRQEDVNTTLSSTNCG